MIQIKVPEAHAITSGSPEVVVGDIDTGVDFTHPDLAANVDFSRSGSCIGGVPNQDPAAWNDDNGHGTHTAGIIAAGANGIGIVGVAPNTRLAAIKAGDFDSFFFPEAVICAFVWAADHGIAVTNNSYYVDPWLYNCRNDPEQRTIWQAERRASCKPSSTARPIRCRARTIQCFQPASSGPAAILRSVRAVMATTHSTAMARSTLWRLPGNRSRATAGGDFAGRPPARRNGGSSFSRRGWEKPGNG